MSAAPNHLKWLTKRKVSIYTGNVILTLFLKLLFFQHLSWPNVVAALMVTDQRSHEALERFQAWKSANKDKGTLQEFVIRQEDLIDDEKNRSSRLCHFAATKAFPDALQTSNAANLACRSGKLLLNQAKVSGGRRVKLGDKITYLNDRSDRRTTMPEDPDRAERFFHSRLRLLDTLSDEGFSHSPLRVLYEDHCMAIVCKPGGIHSMSWAGSLGKSLCLDEILPLLLEPPGRSPGVDKNIDETFRDTDDAALPAPLPRHRLDRRVAGPVVVAKTLRASVEIGRSFEEKTVTKEYRAIVVGEVRVPSDAIQNNSTSFTIYSNIDGKPSETFVVILGKTPCIVNGILTDLKLFPKTGRKHQLRIHCADMLGTPILGDDLHTGRNSGKFEEISDKDHNRPAVRRRQGLFLYCKRISINHPIREGEIVSAEIPEPFRFTRTRSKALKGFEWTLNNKIK